MRRKLFLVALLFIGTVIALSVRAEDLLNCKNVFEGKCYDSSAPLNTSEQKCKTMLEGKCIEYFAPNSNCSNLQYFESPKTSMSYLNKKEQQKVCNNSFGFWYYIDPYAFSWTAMYGQAAKGYITHVEPNSPAARAGLVAGDEIVKINGTKITKFKSILDFSNYVDNQQTVNLVIKGKNDVNLVKANICKMVDVEPYFDNYWGQVCSLNLDWATNTVNYVGRISNMISSQSKAEVADAQVMLNNWLRIKSQFRNGFNLCLSNNYNTSDVNNCLNQLVSRSINSIAHEQNLEMQRTTLQMQQQMQQQQINAMNNYSHALRNQHVQVNANVNHSGTINHNVNQNVNLNGTIYHYNRW